MIDDRILAQTGLELCRREGIEALSFRSLAAAAGIPAASLQSHFKKKERILELVFEAAIDDEVAYLNELSKMAGDTPFSLGNTASVLLQIVNDRTSARRSQAIFLLETIVLATRDAKLRPYVARWTSHLERFWSGIVGEEAHSVCMGRLLANLQFGLELTTVGSPSHLTAMLANQIVVARVVEHRSDGVAWFAQLLRQALNGGEAMIATEEARTELSDRLLLAAAEIVAGEGAGALTFRSIAARAGISLSAITHHFPKRSTLIYGVYRKIYQQLILNEQHMPALESPISEDAIARAIERSVRSGFGGVSQPIAHAELYLLAARDPSLRDLAWHLRMTRGLLWMFVDTQMQQAFTEHAFGVHAETILNLGGVVLAFAQHDAEDELRAVLRPQLAFASDHLFTGSVS